MESYAQQGNIKAKPVAIWLMCAAMLAIAVMDALGKGLSASYALVQILFFRYLATLALALMVRRQPGAVSLWQSRIPLMQVARGVVYVLEATVFLFAFRVLPLAEVTAIGSFAPMFALLLAQWFLKEVVTWRDWLSISVGFVGVILIVQPTGATFDWVAIVPLLGALLWGLYQVAITYVSRYDDAGVTLFYTSIVGVAMTGAALPFVWIRPGLGDLLGLAAVGAVAAIAQWLLIEAFARADASRLQPYNYTMIAWAVLLGWFFFGDFPGFMALIGIVLIVAAGLYVVLPATRTELRN